jgi:hypothetical protein
MRRREAVEGSPRRRVGVSGLHIGQTVLGVSGEHTEAVVPAAVLFDVPHLHRFGLAKHQDLFERFVFVEFDEARVAHALRVVVEAVLRQLHSARRARRAERVTAVSGRHVKSKTTRRKQ